MATTGLIRQLLEAGVHFGHQTKRWNPKMRRYIFGARSGIYIINLEHTAQALERACVFLRELAARGGRVLFVGTKKQAQTIVRDEAQRCEMFYVVNRWLGGSLTNFQTIRKSVARYREICRLEDTGIMGQLAKQESSRLTKEKERLVRVLGGVVTMERLPAALFVIDTKREEIAVAEANRLGIPIVAICDTNSDPEVIAHPVPGNDDAIRSIKLITGLVAEACLEGRRQFALSGQVTPLAQPEAAAEEPVAVAASVDPLAEVEAVAPPAAVPLSEGTPVKGVAKPRRVIRKAPAPAAGAEVPQPAAEGEVANG